MIRIPNNRKWFQSNRGDIYGSIWSSLNIDLTHQRDNGKGNVRLNRMLRGATSATLTNMNGVPFAFRVFDDTTYAAAGDRLYRQGEAHTSSWGEASATSGSVPTNLSSRFSDMEIFNGKLYVSEGTDEDLIGITTGEAYAEIDWGTTGASKPHMLCVYAQRLYMSGVASGNSMVRSMNTSETVAALGAANTVTIGEEFANRITCLRPASDGIWIFTVNTRGGKGYVYFWDGAQSSGVNNSYRLQSAGALAAVIKDDVPYIIDADGRIMYFNGGTFVEVDRLPIRENYLKFAIGNYNERAIHPNGMTVADDRILTLINNEYDTGTLAETIEERVASGIWEWSQETGLYHKYGLSNTPLSGAGVGTLVDYGQNRIETAGACTFIKQDDDVANDNGTLFAGGQIYTNASSTIYGIFIDDLNDTGQKYGYFVTPKIYSPNVEDVWQKVFVRHKKLLESTDKIIVKYRVDEEDSEEISITWVDTDTFTTSTNVSAYTGREVEIIQGDGSGKCAHISSVTGSGPYTVNLDDTFSGITTNTAKARIQKWVKIAEQTNTSVRYAQFPIMAQGTWVQLKVCMQFTGQNEVDDMILVNEGFQLAK